MVFFLKRLENWLILYFIARQVSHIVTSLQKCDKHGKSFSFFIRYFPFHLVRLKKLFCLVQCDMVFFPLLVLIFYWPASSQIQKRDFNARRILTSQHQFMLQKRIRRFVRVSPSRSMSTKKECQLLVYRKTYIHFYDYYIQRVLLQFCGQ